MKILYMTNRAEFFSGGQISLIELLARLDRERFEPVMLCPGEGEMAERARSMGVEVVLWEMSSARSFNLKKLFKKSRELREIIRSSGADIVHTNGSRAQLYASLAVKGIKARLIWHVRESVRDIGLYDRFLAARSDRILCVSEAARKVRFGRHSREDKKVKVIYNGVDTQKYGTDRSAAPGIRRELDIPELSPVIGMIGLMVPLKDHPLLFRAVRDVRVQFPQVKVLVVGRAIEEQYYKALKSKVSSYGIDDNIIFTGQREDVGGLLSVLDVFVLPSVREGFSRSLIEAMSCALPIVATDVGGNPEAVAEGETGLLVKSGDKRALVTAIMYYLTNPGKAREMGLRARDRVIEKFSIERHMSEVQKLYEELAG
ncbi:MAG: glycosyltransferase family 4 protein [Candidatus Tantalella remota]|nr:glycosyltransferase family 4 protein [Candidatus Tantalella remota]